VRTKTKLSASAPRASRLFDIDHRLGIEYFQAKEYGLEIQRGQIWSDRKKLKSKLVCLYAVLRTDDGKIEAIGLASPSPSG